MRTLLRLAVLFLFVGNIYSQNFYQGIDKMLFGAHLNSSVDKSITYYNYNFVEDMGLNFLMQRCIIPIKNKQRSNLSSLSEFPYILAGNDSALIEISPTQRHPFLLENVDFIYNLTGALYSSWKFNDPNFPSNEPVGLKTVVGTLNNGKITAVKGSTSPGLLVTGPNYSQYKKYVLTNKYLNENGFIEYKAVFHLQGSNLEDDALPVCKLIVKANNVELASKILYTNDFPLNNNKWELTYDYNIAGINNIDEKFYDESLKIQFQVDYFGYANLVFDSVEVYDKIWNDKLTPQNILQTVTNIVSYNNQFSSLGGSLKFYHTLDEPHSLDCYTPISKVQQLLDENGIYADLFTHFYPGSNNLRDGVNSFKKWMALAQPKLLNFWYFPYTTDLPSDIDAIWYLNRILGEAHNAKPGFIATVQTWSYQDLVNPNICYTYRVPTQTELSAQITTSLAYGAKGIMFEPFYSYTSWIDQGNLLINANIIGLVNSNFPMRKTVLYDKAKEYGVRLKSNLGKTLFTLNYTGQNEGLCLKNYTPVVINNDNVESNYVRLLSAYLSYPNHYRLLSFFEPKDPNVIKKYFFVSNLLTDNTDGIVISITKPYPSNNLRLRDIEGGVDETYNETIIRTIDLSPGDGKLFSIAPVINYGGNLVYDETISVGSFVTLDEECLVIKSGCTLTVKGTYFIKKPIKVEAGGCIKILGNGKIKTIDAHIEVLGEFIVKGTNTEFSTLDFNESPKSGVTIESEFPVTIENAVIKGGTGLFFNDVKGLVTVKNSKFENCSTAISLNNLREGLISNNNFVNCTQGIYSSNVSLLEINRNNMVSNLGSMPGIFVNSSFGNIRKNSIEGFSEGIVLGNSTVSLAENIIKNNYFHGVIVEKGSYARMKLLQTGESNELYTYGGFNKIYNNGLDPYSEGSEIIIADGDIEINNGYNCIFDERDDQVMAENLFLNPDVFSSPVINGEYNNWGNNNQFLLSDRFDNTTFSYGRTVNCTYPVFLQNNFLINTIGDSSVIDSLYPLDFQGICELSELEDLFNTAEIQFIGGNYETAKAMYMAIVDEYPNESSCLKVYARLFTLQSLIENEPDGYVSLGQYFEGKLSEIENYSLQSSVNQLISLCSVNAGLLDAAIADFNAIIENDPLSEAALFALIDKYTTELLAPPVGMGKGLVKINTGKYSKMVSELVMNKFGRKIENGKVIEVAENYSLSQNYPNPFNPETIIKFSLLKPSKVKLSVFDILGREIKVLVNEYKDAGVYNINFDGRGLSSGVYIYRIDTEYFKDSKKMVIIK